MGDSKLFLNQFFFSELKSLHFQFEKSVEYMDNMEYTNDNAITSTEKPVRSLDRGGFDAESIYYETGFTKVSKLLAFDRLPDLKVVIHRV